MWIFVPFLFPNTIYNDINLMNDVSLIKNGSRRTLSLGGGGSRATPQKKVSLHYIKLLTSSSMLMINLITPQSL